MTSPHKVQVVGKKVNEKLPVFYTDLENKKVQQCKTTEGESSGPRDSSSDEFDDFFYSDYEIEDEDQDMLEIFADGDENEAPVRDSTKTKGNRKAKGSRLKAFDVSRPDLVSGEEDTDEEGLELPESDGEGEGHTFKSFRDQDM